MPIKKNTDIVIVGFQRQHLNALIPRQGMSLKFCLEWVTRDKEKYARGHGGKFAVGVTVSDIFSTEHTAQVAGSNKPDTFVCER